MKAAQPDAGEGRVTSETLDEWVLDLEHILSIVTLSRNACDVELLAESALGGAETLLRKLVAAINKATP